MDIYKHNVVNLHSLFHFAFWSLAHTNSAKVQNYQNKTTDVVDYWQCVEQFLKYQKMFVKE